MKLVKESVSSQLQSPLIQSQILESLKQPRIFWTWSSAFISLQLKKSRQPSSNMCMTAGSILPASRISNFDWCTCLTTASWLGMKDMVSEVQVMWEVKYS